MFRLEIFHNLRYRVKRTSTRCRGQNGFGIPRLEAFRCMEKTNSRLADRPALQKLVHAQLRVSRAPQGSDALPVFFKERRDRARRIDRSIRGRVTLVRKNSTRVSQPPRSHSPCSRLLAPTPLTLIASVPKQHMKVYQYLRFGQNECAPRSWRDQSVEVRPR
jgi:hypothetical protein